MTRRIVIREDRKPTFARSLYDGALPVDMVIAGSIAAVKRPSILSVAEYESENAGEVPQE